MSILYNGRCRNSGAAYFLCRRIVEAFGVGADLQYEAK